MRGKTNVAPRDEQWIPPAVAEVMLCHEFKWTRQECRQHPQEWLRLASIYISELERFEIQRKNGTDFKNQTPPWYVYLSSNIPNSELEQ